MNRSALVATLMFLCLSQAANALEGGSGKPEDIPSLSFRFSDVPGIGKEVGVCRRDPSDVIKIGDAYYVYYTAVQPTPGKGGIFENNATDDPTAIGVAVADDPHGPFARVSNNPVLTVSKVREAFDSYRVDDACLLTRDGKVWLYYKGRSAAHGRSGPGRTRMGLAIADHAAGPFDKQNGGRPVQDSGHEVQIFAYGGAVMSLVSPTGPNGRTLQYAEDGLSFRVLLRRLKNLPQAPGLYRPELTSAVEKTRLPTWGIAMATHGGEPYLVRYECIFF